MERFRSVVVYNARAGAPADQTLHAKRPNRAGAALAGHPTARSVRAVGLGSENARCADYGAVVITTSISENKVANTASTSNSSPFI